MRISEMTNDEALDALLIITPCVDNILGDEELLENLRQITALKGETIGEIYAIGAKRITSLLPILLKSHRADVYGIIGAVNGMTVSEVAKCKLVDTIEMVKEIVNDEVLADFFKSRTGAEKKES